MHKGECASARDASSSSALCARERMTGATSRRGDKLTAARPNRCELRVERYCLFVERLGLVHRLGRDFPMKMPGLQQGFVGGKLGRIPRLGGCLRRKRDLRCLGDGCGYLVLHRKYVRQLAVETLRPQVGPISRGDQLRGHADAIARAPHAPFENIGHAQRLGDPADVGVLPLEGERGSARDYFQPGNLCQGVDDLLRQAVAEVLLLLVAAHIGEGQYRDGG